MWNYSESNTPSIQRTNDETDTSIGFGIASNNASSEMILGNNNADDQRTERIMRNVQNSSPNDESGRLREVIYGLNIRHRPSSESECEHVCAHLTDGQDVDDRSMDALQMQRSRPYIVSKLGGKIGKDFKSYKKLEKYAKRIAIKEGFNFVTGHSKAGKYSDQNSRVELKCHMHNRGQSEKKRSRGARSGTSCRFRIVASRQKANQRWIFKVLGEHNHPKMLSKGALALAEGLSDRAKGIIVELLDKDYSHQDIFKIIREKCPRESITRSLVRNFVNDHKAELMKNSTRVARLFTHLRVKNYFVSMCGDTDKDLSRFFFAPRQQVRMLCHYGSVLIMDSTYKTNRYKLPLFHIIGLSPYNTTFQVAFSLLDEENEEAYKWALLQLKSIYPRNKGPAVLVTDRELALGNAIKVVFPKAKHIICKWHVKRDIKRKLKSLSYDKEFKEELHAGWIECMEAKTEEEFHFKWGRFETTHGKDNDFVKYLDINWVSRKEQLVTAWVRKIRHFGTLVTSRVEGSHSHFKDNLAARFKEIGYVVDKIDEYCKLEVETLREKVGTNPYASMKPKEAHLLAWIVWDVTSFCIEKMIQEYRLINLPRNAKLLDLDSESLARVQDLAGQISTCECDSKITYGIPCQHMISMRITNKERVALGDIHEQWKICYPFHSEKFFLDKRSGITTKKLKKICKKAIETMDHHSLDVQCIITSLVLEITKEPPILHNIAIARKRRGRPVGSYAQESSAQANDEGDIAINQEEAMGNRATKRRRVHADGRLKIKGRRGRPPKRIDVGNLLSNEQHTQPYKKRKGGKRKHCKRCHKAGHNVRTCPQRKESGN